MTELGKPLVFYLKHMAEMNHLYGDPEDEGEKLDLTGLDNATKVREMVRTVGAAAYEQVADFLELCWRGIEAHFTGLGIATPAGKKTRARVKKNWNQGTVIRVSSVPTFWCGVGVTAPPEVRIELAKDVCGVVTLWLVVVKGGRKAEDEIWRVVGSWAHSRGVEGLIESSGTVALACIPIKAQPPDSFDVDRDPLVAEVLKTIRRIGAKETKAIARFVAGLKEPEDS